MAQLDAQLDRLGSGSRLIFGGFSFALLPLAASCGGRDGLSTGFRAHSGGYEVDVVVAGGNAHSAGGRAEIGRGGADTGPRAGGGGAPGIPPGAGAGAPSAGGGLAGGPDAAAGSRDAGASLVADGASGDAARGGSSDGGPSSVEDVVVALPDAEDARVVADAGDGSDPHDAREGTLALLAGGLGGAGWQDGIGTMARLNYPEGLAFDGASTLFLSDTYNHTIRRMDVATGEVTTLAGLAGMAGDTDGVGTAARFDHPWGLALDGVGNLFVADYANHEIRKIVIATNEVTTVAGIAAAYGNADGIGTAARFGGPAGLAWDGAGALFVADYVNDTIRKVSLATREVSTFAGLAQRPGRVDGIGVDARLSQPTGVAVDGAGHLFLADRGNCAIRKAVIATGEVTTLALWPTATIDDAGAISSEHCPWDLTFDEKGNLLGTDGDTVRSIGVGTGEVVDLADVVADSGTDSGTDAGGRRPWFVEGRGIASDRAGHLFVADMFQNTIKKVVVESGEVSTVAGSLGSVGAADGTGASARFSYPTGIVSDGSGNLLVADTGNNTIRKLIVATGAVETLAGVSGAKGANDAVGTLARFFGPSGLAFDATANELLISDRNNHVLRKLDMATGEVTTIAGSATNSGFRDGIGQDARFNQPDGIALDPSGNLFVADTLNHIIRKLVIATGEVTTFAGVPGYEGTSDGVGASGQFTYPHGLTLDGLGNLYVSDVSLIRKVVIATGEVSTLVGYHAGRAARAFFNNPYGLRFDGADSLVIADYGDHAIRRFALATGEVTTLVGVAGRPGVTLGPLPGGLNGPAGVELGSSGELFITSEDEHDVLVARF